LERIGQRIPKPSPRLHQYRLLALLPSIDHGLAALGVQNSFSG
jgi:hypothetical protein